MKPSFFVMAAIVAAVMWRWRRKLEPTLIVGGSIVIAGLVLYGTGWIEMPDWEKVLEDVGQELGRWTYLVVAVFAFLETGAFVGLIAPGETVMVFGGVIAGQGTIEVFTLIGIVWIAAILGDVTSFYLGRRLGRAFLVQHGPKFQITEERLEQVEGFFQRHGGKTILIGRFVGLVRAIAPFLAGSSGMKFKRFLPYDVIGAGLWATAFIVLGFVFWRSFEQIAVYAERGALALGTSIALIAGIVLAVRWIRTPGNRHKAELWMQAQADRPLARPLVKVLRPVWRVTDRPRRFFVGRITPGELGLEMTTLFAIAGVGLFVFVAPIVTLRDRVLTPTDERANELLAGINANWVETAAKIVTEFGALRVMIPAVLIAAAYTAFRRRIAEALTLPIGLALTIAAVNITLPLQDRPRPPDPLVDVSGPSFPSGHAAYALAWIAIAVVLTRTVGYARLTSAIIVACVLATAVALSRVYLRTNYLSDVAAGAGVAAVMFALCAMVALVTEHLRQNGARHNESL